MINDPASVLQSQFSLTNVMTITLDPGAAIIGSSGGPLVHSPEPGTPVLALTGLPLATPGLLLRRLKGRRA
jgi:hypothetical protein